MLVKLPATKVTFDNPAPNTTRSCPPDCSPKPLMVMPEPFGLILKVKVSLKLEPFNVSISPKETVVFNVPVFEAVIIQVLSTPSGPTTVSLPPSPSTLTVKPEFFILKTSLLPPPLNVPITLV